MYYYYNIIVIYFPLFIQCSYSALRVLSQFTQCSFYAILSETDTVLSLKNIGKFNYLTGN